MQMECAELIVVRMNGVVNGFDQSLAGYRFWQKSGATNLTGLFMNLGFIMCGDENDRGFFTIGSQLATQIKPGHPAQIDVEHIAIDCRTRTDLQKFLGGMENNDLKPSRAQHSLQRPGIAFVVIHHRDNCFVFEHFN